MDNNDASRWSQEVKLHVAKYHVRRAELISPFGSELVSGGIAVWSLFTPCISTWCCPHLKVKGKLSLLMYDDQYSSATALREMQ